MKKLMIILAVWVIASGDCVAGGVPCPVNVSSLGRNYLQTFLHDIVYEGDTAFRGGKSSVNAPIFGLFDVSNPLEHELIASVELPVFVSGFEIHGSLAYLCLYSEGLYIYDISDVNNMFEVGHVTLEDNTWDVVVDNGFAYVSSSSTLYAIDVSDPAQPMVVDSSVESSRVYDLVFHNDAVYGASDGGVFRFDLLSEGQFDPAVVVGSGIGTLSVVIENDILYATAWSNGVFIADISDPDNPVTLAMHGTEGSAFSLKKYENRLYVCERENGLVIIDVENPAAPLTIWRYEMPFEAWSAAVDPIREVLFVSGNLSADGAEVFDISVIPVSSILDFESTANGSWSSVSFGSSVVLAAGQTIYTLDASDPLSIEQASLFSSGSTSRDIAITGQMLCVAAGGDGLMLLDGTDPNNLQIISTLDVPGLADSIFVLDGVAYLGTLTGGISIVDISDPANPVLLSSYDTEDLVREVHLHGDYLFAAGSQGLMVFDVADRGNPVLVFESDSGPSVMSMDVAGDLLYLGLISTGFDVLDVSDPTSPELVVHVDATDRVREIEMHEGVLYYTVDNDGLYAAEIDGAGLLTDLGYIGLEGQLNDLEFDGDRAFLSDRINGVYLLDVANTCGNCPADLTGEGIVDFFDISAFLQFFGNQDSAADLNGDGIWDFFDVSAFLQDYAAGCP